MSDLQGKLKLIKRRLVWNRLCSGIVLILLAAVLSALAAVAAGFAAQEVWWPEWIVRVFAIGLFLFAFWLGWLKPFSFPLHDEGLAVFLERRLPGLDSRLITWVQLRNRQVESPELMQALKGTTDKSLSESDLRRVSDWKVFRRYFLFLVLTTLVLGVCVWRFPGQFSTSAGRIFDWSRIKPSLLTLFKRSPLGSSDWALGDIRLTYRYPAYTGLPDKTIENSDGAISALKGTQVRYTATSSVPLGRADLALKSGTNVSLTIGRGGREVSGEVTLLQSDFYSIEGQLTGKHLLPTKKSQAYTIEVLSDQYPKVVIEKPATDLDVKADGKIEIAYQIDDDFGLSRLELRASRAGKELTWNDGSAALILRQFSDKKNADAGTFSVDLRNLNLRADAAGEADPAARKAPIDLVLRVFDNDTVSGPKSADSAIRRLNLITEQRIREDLLAKEEQIFEGLLDSLALGLEIFAQGQSGKLPEESLFNDLQGSLRRVTGSIGGLMEVLKQNQPDPASKDAEAVKLETLSDVQKTLRKLSSAASPERANRGLNEHLISEFEDVVLLFERFVLSQRSEALMDEGREMLDKFSKLQETMKKLADGKATPEQLAEAQKALENFQRQYQEYLRRMSKSVSTTPMDEFINPEALREMLDQSPLSAMERARQKLQAGDMQGAMKEMADLEREFNQMKSEMAQSGSEQQKKTIKQLNESMEKLDQAITGQKKLLRETENLQGDLRKRVAEKQEAQNNVFLKQQLMRIATILKNIGLFEQENVRIQQVRDFLDLILRSSGEVRDAVKLLEEDLKREDIESAIPSAHRTLSLLRRLKGQAQNTYQLIDEPPREIARKQEPLVQSEDLTKKILGDLEDLETGRQKSLTPGEKQRASQLKKGQEGLRERAENLDHDLRQLGKDVPMIGPNPLGTGEKEGTEKFPELREAAEKLGSEDISGAIPQQRNGLFRLEKARKRISDAMESAKNPRGGPGSVSVPSGFSERGGQGTANNQEKVEIPGREAYKVPEDFRREIMDAMKKPAPKNYEKLNEEYYEKLVK